TDKDPTDTVSYSISGGEDYSLFSIDSSTGVLTFNSVPDYETPENDDHQYEVIVQASDGPNTDTQKIIVTVNNDNDNNPVMNSDGGGDTATKSIDENTTYVTTVQAKDADKIGKPTYSIIGGADKSKFTINEKTGKLAFNSAPDFENPNDSDRNHN